MTFFAKSISFLQETWKEHLFKGQQPLRVLLITFRVRWICNLQHTAILCNTLVHTTIHCSTTQHTATHYSTLQHTATYCSTLRHTAAHCSKLQHTAAHCNLQQHTATHGHQRVRWDWIFLERTRILSGIQFTKAFHRVCCCGNATIRR